MITSSELRRKYLEFFKAKGHAVIPSSSLVPENDPTVLFTTAGMHPLVPYLLGEKHPSGKRLTDVQKCIRTGDIDDVGDASHCTFFEMLGNWSLGDYFKKDAIRWSWEFLTSPEWLGLPVEKLAVSVFAGDADCPRDEESANIWAACGMPRDRIFYLPKKNNWWGPAGKTGPCGPDSEMFIVRDQPDCGPDCSPACDCGKYLEIWNDVFMQYNKTNEGTFEPLQQRNVDTGMGLERTIGVLQGVKSVYDTDLFKPVIAAVEGLSGLKYGEDAGLLKAFRIISDHIRSATFILGDEKGVTPSNTDQGYILRRLIRRAVRYGRQLNLPAGFTARIADVIVDSYASVYPELQRNRARITGELLKEEERFSQTIEKGMKEFSHVADALIPGGMIEGIHAFHLYDTYGFPLEMTVELAAERGLKVDTAGYEEAFKKHQEVSNAGATQRFGGGLADHSEQVAKLHTATHLLHAGLRKYLGATVEQRGSNITPERLRFDFSFTRPMTDEEVKLVEEFVNEAIQAASPIVCEELPIDDARKTGAIGLFGSKYGDVVKVFTMGDWSKEICGGPHASSTGDLGWFKIEKEQSSSAGVRRIRAVIDGCKPE
jgi:alanyl-tRNA synthetase